MLNEIFRLFGTIVVDNESAKRNIDETVKHADAQQKKLQQKLADFGKAAIKFGTAFATTAATLGTALVNVANNTRDYRTQMALLETAFEMNELSAENAQGVYKTLYGVIGDTGRVVEAAQSIAQLADDEKELHDWTDICTGVFATLGERLPIESLTEAANETAKTGEVTGGLADALNWAGEDANEFQKELDACNTEEERAEKITDTLVGLYGEAARAYRENNSALIEANNAHDGLNSAMATLGEKAEPVVTTLEKIATKLVEKATPAVEGMASGMGSILENFEAFGAWIEENKTAIMAVLGPLVITLIIMKAPLVLLGAAIAFVASNWKVLAEGVAWCVGEIDKFFNITIPQAWKDMCESIGTWWNDNVLTPINNAIAAITEFFGLNESGGYAAATYGQAAGVNMGTHSGGGNGYMMQTTFLGDGSGIGSRLRGFASGIDFVPGNDIAARLHYGEAVLTRSEANAWRRGQTGGIDYDRLAEAMAARPMAFNIDGKAFAVMLAREMNRAIGNRNIQTLMAMGG